MQVRNIKVVNGRLLAQEANEMMAMGYNKVMTVANSTLIVRDAVTCKAFIFTIKNNGKPFAELIDENGNICAKGDIL